MILTNVVKLMEKIKVPDVKEVFGATQGPSPTMVVLY